MTEKEITALHEKLDRNFAADVILFKKLDDIENRMRNITRSAALSTYRNELIKQVNKVISSEHADDL
jgi:uncharacterized membrane protein